MRWPRSFLVRLLRRLRWLSLAGCDAIRFTVASKRCSESSVSRPIACPIQDRCPASGRHNRCGGLLPQRIAQVAERGVGIDGPAEQIALAAGTAELDQPLGLRFLLDALGD